MFNNSFEVSGLDQTFHILIISKVHQKQKQSSTRTVNLVSNFKLNLIQEKSKSK